MLKKLTLLFFVSAEISIALCCFKYDQNDFLSLSSHVLYDTALEAEKLTQGERQEKGVDGKDMYVALGVTGSGISTFSSVMLNYRPKKNSRGLAIADPNVEPPFGFASEVNSVTSCPSIKKIPGTNKFICDNPGFLDRMGKFASIRNEMIRNIILKKFNHINGLIVVFDEFVLEDKFLCFNYYLFGFIGKLIPFNRLFKSVLFVFNKKSRLHPFNIEKVLTRIYNEAVQLHVKLSTKLIIARGIEKKLLILQIEMLKNSIQVLQLIIFSGVECLVEFDPFDDGETRKKVLDLASKLEPIPTSMIDFVAASPECNLFISGYRDKLVNKVRAMKDYLETSVEGPEIIGFESRKIIKLFEYLNFDSEEHPNLTKDIIRLSKEVESKKNRTEASGDV